MRRAFYSVGNAYDELRMQIGVLPVAENTVSPGQFHGFALIIFPSGNRSDRAARHQINPRRDWDER